jgi:hypothetical protein
MKNAGRVLGLDPDMSGGAVARYMAKVLIIYTYRLQHDIDEFIIDYIIYRTM